MINMDLVTEDTLPDDAWKDSFDKLLDQRPVLRELKVIKRDVRASFNMDSSYENSYDNTASIRPDCEEQLPQQKESFILDSSPVCVRPNMQYLDVPKNINANIRNKQRMITDVISTPIRNITTDPFKCALSPIGPWELRHFKSKDQNKDNKKYSNKEFNATPIVGQAIVNVELFDDLKSPNIEKQINPRLSMGISPLVLVRKKWKSKQSQKQVCFVTNDLDKKHDMTAERLNRDIVEVVHPPLCPELELQPGKWRKSLNCLRRTLNPILENDTNCKSLTKKQSKRGSAGVLEKRKSSTTTCIAGNRKSVCIRSKSGSRSTYSLGSNDFKRQLLQRCGQRRILTFDGTYSEDYLRNCQKIGEGAFGEVFVHLEPKEPHADNESAEKTVLKIIPIEGKELVNGEVQKTFEQILPEVIISMELCSLSDDSRTKNVASGFVNLKRVRCIKGSYPAQLQQLWEEYDLKKESENDHPKCFTSIQQYIVLELAYSGQDLEAFQFKNAEQSFYALQQIILTLAVGENEYQFEHRDLHWGNVLLLNTNRQNMEYKLGDDTMTIPTKGIEITIIDYTLSRMTFNDYCFYNDLSNDEELFIATGDYQFEIYRMMRKVLNNKWEMFEPKTNIYWISYIISKLVEAVSYKNKRSKIHLHYLEKLKDLQTSVLTYKSCVDCARDMFLH